MIALGVFLNTGRSFVLSSSSTLRASPVLLHLCWPVPAPSSFCSSSMCRFAFFFLTATRRAATTRRRAERRIKITRQQSLCIHFHAVVSRVLKELIRQPRPEASCTALGNCHEHGMPSSHSQFMTFSCTIAILIFTRRYARVHHRHSPPPKSEFTSSLIASPIYLLELSIFVTATILTCWARVYLGYHTVLQVVIGALLGVLNARLWVIVMDHAHASGALQRCTRALKPICPLRCDWWPTAITEKP